MRGMNAEQVNVSRAAWIARARARASREVEADRSATVIL
jgi:hypothetical protein